MPRRTELKNRIIAAVGLSYDLDPTPPPYLHERPEKRVESRLYRVRVDRVVLKGGVERGPEQLHAQHRKNEAHEQHQSHHRPEISSRLDHHANYRGDLLAIFSLWGQSSFQVDQERVHLEFVFSVVGAIVTAIQRRVRFLLHNHQDVARETVESSAQQKAFLVLTISFV